ncbi:MAG TPA: response regulator, partial [Syntrophomonas sp.]|nr:response regulator [Syntrophomonas sp.]
MSATILVVDDSASDRLIIKNMLNEYRVLTACDGLEAMREIDAQADIDLVILDLNVPNMNGFEVLGALQSNERYKKLRTLILTNHDELDNEIKGLKMGAVDYIRKPIHMEFLKARMEIHLELLRIQKLVEHKLYEQGLTLDTVFSQAPIGIAINEPSDDAGNGMVAINPMYEQITGRSKEELLKLGWGRITHPDDLDEDLQNLQKLQAGEIKSYIMEKRFIKPDGSIVWVHMVVAPLTLSNQSKFNHICLVQDISERKRMENDLRY